MLKNTALLNKKIFFMSSFFRLIVISLFLQYCKTRTKSGLNIVEGSLENNSLRISNLKDDSSGQEDTEIKDKINIDFESRFRKGMVISDSNMNPFSYSKFRHFIEKNSKYKNQVSFKIGKRNYKLLRKLGLGFFYNVYAIYPTESPKEYYTIKIPHNIFTTNEYIKEESSFYNNIVKKGLGKYTTKSEILCLGLSKHEKTSCKNNECKKNVIIKEYVEGKTIQEIFEETKSDNKELVKSLMLALNFICQISNAKIINIDPNLANFIVLKKDPQKIKLIDGWPQKEIKTIGEALKWNIAYMINITNFKVNAFVRNSNLSKNCSSRDRLLKIASDLYMGFQCSASHLGVSIKEKIHLSLFVPSTKPKEAMKVMKGFYETLDYVFCNTLEFVNKNKNLEVIDFNKVKTLYLENVKKHCTLK